MTKDVDIVDLKTRTKACVFDAYGTLFDLASAAMAATDEFSENMGTKTTQLSQIWRTKQIEYSWIRTMMGEHKDFWQVTGDALDFAMEHLELDSEALRDRLMELYFTLDAFPEVYEVLSQLKQAGLKTAILSNGSPEMLQGAIGHSNITDLLDEVYSIEQIGIYKPDPRVYRIAVDGLGLAPENICFVSANGWDVAGGANLGLSVIWVNRYKQVPERLPGLPLHEISDLKALPELLGI